jgi:quinol monooxygenase YgiN
MLFASAFRAAGPGCVIGGIDRADGSAQLSPRRACRHIGIQRSDEMSDSNEVVLIAEATALPGKRDELLRAFRELVPRALDEAGVSAFRLHEDREQPGHFTLYERYDDQGAVESHFATEHFLVISKALAELAQGAKPRITFYEVLTD